MSATTHTDAQYIVAVLGLDDVVPRRDPKRPNLLVARTKRSIDEFADDIRDSRGRGHAWAHGHVTRTRFDLSDCEPRTFAEAGKIKKQVTNELTRKGYTVNKDENTWRTYVINLHDPNKGDVGAGYVYVGETSRTADERLQQHLTGVRNSRGPLFSRVVNRFGTGLNRDLMTSKVYMTEEQAKKAERRLAERLRSAGYLVEGGH